MIYGISTHSEGVFTVSGVCFQLYGLEQTMGQKYLVIFVILYYYTEVHKTNYCLYSSVVFLKKKTCD